ncbi:unnamed protein product [Caenorhabditis bovis]|uniref:Uncharacterized protein n=1 Tax=Caenorhabditis bovis TaxID=2654633 RepID=A0A8S1EC04_9PELO|nr:unnamed protein product [Caenorhabditis bovis]
MPPGSVVVTGANRGIGLGLVRQFLKDSQINHIIATARNPDKANELRSINDKRLHLLPLDVDCDKSIVKFVDNVKNVVGDKGLNLLVNNAGIFTPYEPKQTPDRSLVAKQLDTNVTSVIILTQHLLPLITQAAIKNGAGPEKMSIDRAAVIVIGSQLGSISQNKRGSSNLKSLVYGVSKAAIHQFVKTISIDLKNDGILTASFHPGWVQTDMGGPHGPLTVEQSTSALVESFAKLNERHSGGLYDPEFSTITF